MKKINYLAIISILLFTSCTQRGCQRVEKKFQFSQRDYEVIMYSGGDTVFYDKFNGIVNGEEGTDGFFYFKGDTLVEIGGDYVLKSVN